MSKIYIGVDNGVTGSITILYKNDVFYSPIPIKQEQSYTKKRQNISRINTVELREIFREYYIGFGSVAFCLIERPMVNPMRWKASLSAIRALEATLIVLEELNVPYQYCDSKEWQGMFLPKPKPSKQNKHSMKFSTSELKRLAVDAARRLFPKIKTKDADSLLIAEYARRKGF